MNYALSPDVDPFCTLKQLWLNLTSWQCVRPAVQDQRSRDKSFTKAIFVMWIIFITCIICICIMTSSWNIFYIMLLPCVLVNWIFIFIPVLEKFRKSSLNCTTMIIICYIVLLDHYCTGYQICIKCIYIKCHILDIYMYIYIHIYIFIYIYSTMQNS